MPGRFSVESVFKAVDKVSAPVNSMQNRINKFTRTTRDGVNRAARSFRDLGNSIRSSAAIGTAGIVAIGAAMIPVINTFGDFEQSLTNAAAKFPGMVKDGVIVQEQYEKIEKAARKTGAATEFTASQSAKALDFLAMAGFTAAQAIEALPKVVDLATAAQTDLATASDIASDALGAFGMAVDDPVQKAKNLQRVMDVMAKTATTSNTNLEMMMETIKQGGPIAVEAGQSIESFAAMTGILANSGIKASDAGTTVKNVFTRLTGPVGKAAKIMDFLKVKTKDADGNMRDIADIMGDLNKGLNTLGKADRLAAIKEIFGKIPLSGVSILLKEGKKGFQDYRDVIIDSAGATSEMAKVMRNTTKNRIKALGSAIESIAITIGYLVQGPLDWLTRKLTGIARAIEGHLSQNTLLGKALIATAVAVGAVTTAITTMTGVVISAKIAMFTYNGVLAMVPKSLFAVSTASKAASVNTMLMGGAATKATFATKAMTIASLGLTKVLAVLTSPITLIIAAFAAVVYIGWKVAKNWDALTEKWNNMSAAGKIFVGVLALMFAPITAMIAGLVAIIKAGDWLVDNWSGIKLFFIDFWDSLIDKVKSVIDFFRPLGSVLVKPFMPIIRALEMIEEKLGVITKIKNIGSSITGAAGEAFDLVKTGLGFGDDEEEEGGSQTPSMVTPQERTARSIEEKRTTSLAEVLVRADNGTQAELIQKKKSPGVTLGMTPSGAF